ncbi:HAD family hydrolase [Paenibacillus yanchengensis]|uniref:HAD family hydrolase n=1 Tax=Paenibacillus yanchengensis TaxID=2035833 RepID=A0ABW4YR27_9BACL
MTIKAVLFDLDGTLLDREASLLTFLSDQYERFSVFHAIEKDLFIQRFITLDDNGYVWKDKVYQQMIHDFSIKHIDWSLLLNDYIDNFQKYCIGFPNLLSTLMQLKKHRMKLALVSNGWGQFQFNNLKGLQIEHLFDEILISDWVGLRKPDPAIFIRALSKLKSSPEQAIFVGDHPINDIRASQAVGMQAIWKRSPHVATVTNVEADAIIDDLEEIIPFVLSNRTVHGR